MIVTLKTRLSQGGGRDFDEVLVDGKRLSPARSQKVFNHSPDGFAWGYGGSGPAQLALALLLEHGLTDEDAVRLHQDLKFEVVAGWPQESGEHELDLQDWIDRHAERHA